MLDYFSGKSQVIDIPECVFWDGIFTLVLKVRFPRVHFLGWDFHCDFLEKYSNEESVFHSKTTLS